jgi:hypothetical protein
MPYKIDPIRLMLEPSKVTIYTTLYYYEVVPEVPADPEAVPPVLFQPAYDNILNSRQVNASSKVNPFDNASVNAAKTILVDNIMEMIKGQRKMMDKEMQFVGAAVLTNLYTAINTRLQALP